MIYNLLRQCDVRVGAMIDDVVFVMMMNKFVDEDADEQA